MDQFILEDEAFVSPHCSQFRDHLSKRISSLYEYINSPEFMLTIEMHDDMRQTITNEMKYIIGEELYIIYMMNDIFEANHLFLNLIYNLSRFSKSSFEIDFL